MAAKPPKPPGNFLKNSTLNNTNNNDKSNSNNNNNSNNIEGNSDTATISTCGSANDTCNNTPTKNKKANCNCTNITIMHLFHEMKQEFPTIPDTIVAQCVNENCHQRENCIQMLRNELELNPIPVQSYPAKVLHPPNTNNNNNNNSSYHQHLQQQQQQHLQTTTSPSPKPPLQQKPTLQQRTTPSKPPLKPVRPAPLQPSPSQTSNNNTPAINNKSNKPNSPLFYQKTTSGQISTALSDSVGGIIAVGYSPIGDIDEKLNDMPAKTSSIQTPQQQRANTNSPSEVNNNENCNSVGESNESSLPRARPTTLNLNVQQQKQQRQRLNIQLQEHFQQQRNKHQSTPPPLTQTTTNTSSSSVTTKPLRKAPLPPIAPKPILFHHTNNNNGDSLSSHTTSPLSESEISVNVSLSTPSPTSSSSAAGKTHHTQHLQNKSPIRHRSVITLQPEPPYTRDFFQTPSTTSNASSSVVSSPTNSQKSYTSVNLTLRPPTAVANSALQPSAIDITAGPGFSGASGGGKSLSYSSTSYDARLGYQQNFHITVTDEGGVFSASRRRPQRNSSNQVNICENQYDGNSDGDKNNHVNSLCAIQQKHLNQQKPQQQQLQYLQSPEQFHNNQNSSYVVAALQQQQQYQQQQQNINSPQGIGSVGFGSMCLAPQQAEDDFVTETLERQKKRRDKLAAVLRENKKRLSQVEHEVNLITGIVPVGLSERLDVEILQLRAECQAMLRSSNPLMQTSQPINRSHQFPPQPFPRERPARPPPRPPPPRQTSLDIIQHHATPTTPHTPASLPNFLNTPSPTMLTHQQQQQQLLHSHSLSPSMYQQQQSPVQSVHPLHAITSEQPDNEAYYSDQENNADYEDEDDDEYELVDHWECNMCTFRNHPQLNICECCENVRILPGTLTNLSRAISTNSTMSASAADGLTSVDNRSVTDVNAAAVASGSVDSLNAAASSTANGNLEHDTNVARQLAQFALHT